MHKVNYMLNEHLGAVQLFGLVWSGPSMHFWQQLQERIFKGRRDTATLIKRVRLTISSQRCLGHAYLTPPVKRIYGISRLWLDDTPALRGYLCRCCWTS